MVPNCFRGTSVSLALLPGTVDVSRQGDSTVSQGPPACAVLLMVMCSLVSLVDFKGNSFMYVPQKTSYCVSVIQGKWPPLLRVQLLTWLPRHPLLTLDRQLPVLLPSGR